MSDDETTFAASWDVPLAAVMGCRQKLAADPRACCHLFLAGTGLYEQGLVSEFVHDLYFTLIAPDGI